ncbi:MAG: glycosyltransferase family 39 protein [bacterium]|nr:glycosyltransferase family 39 protein [bacterium]
MSHILIFILVAFVILYLLFISKFGIDLEDEGLLMHQGVRLLNGEIPWRDFTLTYTGGSMFLNAFLFRIFGTNIMVIRYILLVFSLLTTFLMWLLSKKLMPTKFAIFPPILFLILGLPFCFVQYPGWYFILFVFLSVFALLLYYQSRKRLWLLAAGICAGLTFLFKYSVGTFHFIGIILALLFIDSVSDAGHKPILPSNRLKVWVKWTILFLVFLFCLTLFGKHSCLLYTVLLLQVYTILGFIIYFDIKRGLVSGLDYKDFIFPIAGFLISISPLILYLGVHNIFPEFFRNAYLTIYSIRKSSGAVSAGCSISFLSLLIIYPCIFYPICINLKKYRIRFSILSGIGYLIIVIVSAFYIKSLSPGALRLAFFSTIWESRLGLSICIYWASFLYILYSYNRHKLSRLPDILFTFIYITGVCLSLELYPSYFLHILWSLVPSFILGIYLLYKCYCNLRNSKRNLLWRKSLFLFPVCFLLVHLLIRLDYFIDMKTLFAQRKVTFDKRPVLPFPQLQVRVSEEDYKNITGIKCYMDSVLNVDSNIFTNIPIFYILLDKKAPMKFNVYRGANMLKDSVIQAEFIREWDNKKISYVIDLLGTLFSSYPEENKMLQSYLETHYSMVREFGPCQIYQWNIPPRR